MRLHRLSSLSVFASCIFVSLLASPPSPAQTAASPASAAQAPGNEAPITPARINEVIDPNNLVVLNGNVHPQAQPQYDQGAVPDSQPLHRILLLLQRSPAQEQALRQLLDDQQSKSAANFHTWLTPDQFGAQYGPALADVQTITSWLAAQGFKINRISAARTVIEFDGTAGQVRNTFHTEIHRYLIAGQQHTANASDPAIPAALAPVVAGIVSLHNFPATSHLLTVGAYQRNRKTGQSKPLLTPAPTNPNHPPFSPLFTPPNSDGQTYPLVPADFATIYNVTPLWNSGIDGTGQTIAVIGASNINVSDIQNFRALFGLSSNFTSANVIIDGVDPGIDSDAETEADLDIEWSGAVAKGATIQFVAAASTEVTGGQHLSALYAVDHNLGAVLSESFGVCEKALGTTDNLYYSTLWEQAAAQGITVVISAGDGGSAGCDDFDTATTATQGLAVSGYASTPFDVAVGGTDFDQIFKWTQYWSASNDPNTLASVLGYIPEIPWNDSCAQLGLTACGTSQRGGDLLNIVAGSGGASTVYSKPSWQSGLGVPSDNKRDIPDVSLFASNGFTGSGYMVCAADRGGYCQSGSPNFSYSLIGGTSASAPSFAGIMALVNQSQAKLNFSNRQGVANYVLYALAKKQANVTPALNCNASASPVSSCTFNDITSGDSYFPNHEVGTNSVPCTEGALNCSATVSGSDGILVTPAITTPKTPAWTTSTGYDLATGLGSVNALNLATNWGSANSVATTTTLSLNSGAAVNITHGAPVSVSVAVTPKTAVGDVALVATYPPSPASPNGSTLGMAQFTLTSGAASGNTSNLAGGTYSVTAHYEGDGTNAPSDSLPVSVIVAPEASKTLFTVPTFNPSTGNETTNTPTTLVYGSPYILRADVTNSSGSLTQLCASVNAFSCPSGTVTLSDSLNGAAAQPVDAGTFALNSAGYTEDQTVQLSGGTHMLTAQYSGDNSYTKSTSSTYPLTVTPAPTNSLVNEYGANPTIGQIFTLAAQADAPGISGSGVDPTGTITFYDGASQLPGTPSQTANSQGVPIIYATLNTSVTTGGAHSITAKYSGDANYASSVAAPISVFAIYPTTTTVALSTPNIVYGANVTVSATVNTNVKTPALTGQVQFYSTNGPIQNPVTQTVGTDPNGNTQIMASVIATPPSTEFISASYQNDNNFAASNSPDLSVQVNTPDFSFVSPPPIVFPAGQTGMATLTFTPLSNLTSTVMVSCAGNLPVGSVCTLTPSSVNLANGQPGTTIVSLSSIAPSPSPAIVRAQRRSFLSLWPGTPRIPWWPLGVAAGLAALALLSLPWFGRRPRLKFSAVLAAAFLCVVSFALGCGGGGGGGGSVGPPPPPLTVSTTTTLSSATPKVPQGTNATITATVTSSKNPTGTVTFYAGDSYYPPVTLLNGTAQIQISNLSVGTYPVTGRYSGDTNNLPSTSPVFNQVVTGSTTFTVTAQTGVNTHQINVTATLQ